VLFPRGFEVNRKAALQGKLQNQQEMKDQRDPAVLPAHLKPRQDPAKEETGNFCLTSPVNKVYKTPH
jgi:hypothetical protein